MLPKKQNNDLLYQIALTLIPGIGPKTAAALLQHFGTAEEVFRAAPQQIKRVEGIGAGKVVLIKDPDILRRASAEAEFATREGIRCLFIDDPDYPYRLKYCNDAPVLLFSKGNADLNVAKTVAVIGTRKSTAYGQELCDMLINGLKRYRDLLVISGMAYGIDAAAHKKCVKEGVPTTGVLAHGLDRIYPFAHKSLAAEMCACGGLLTEFPSGTNPDKTNFPIRNRIVAGMSDVVVVVESDLKGGAVITAYLAAGYNREVAAFPGRVHDPCSRGCHMLIRKNIAAMITSADDLADLMGWQTQTHPRAIQPELLPLLTPEQQTVMGVFRNKEILHTDELLQQTTMNSSLLAATLLGLEMQGMLKALPGKYYRRC